jgi:hypothetical protein
MKFTTGVFCGVAACVAFLWVKEGQSEEHGNAIIAAYNKGKTDALKTQKPSWELEQACVSLWAGRQE